MPRPPPPTPETGVLPHWVSPSLVFDFVRALPRPHPANPDGYGGQMIHAALETLRYYLPTNPLQAALAVQIVTHQVRARQAAQLAAASEADPEQMQRAEKSMLALSRSAGAAERQLVRNRLEMTRLGEVPEPTLAWDYEVAALEAVWREGPLMAGLAPPAATRGARTAAAVPGEAPGAAPGEAGYVPLWKRAGKQYINDVTDEELKELTDAVARGAPMEEPPVRPGSRQETWVPGPKLPPYIGWENMTMQQRKERWGYRSEEEIEADRVKAAAAEAARKDGAA